MPSRYEQLHEFISKKMRMDTELKPTPTRAKLTKSYIDRTAHKGGKFDDIHWDTEIKGFGLKVTPKGKRSFIVQGRTDRKGARITIGTFGIFTVDQARDQAREHLRNMRLGIDPRADAKKQAALRTTLREVADTYMRDRNLKDSSKAKSSGI